MEKPEILPDIFHEGALDSEIRYFSSIVKRYASRTSKPVIYDQVVALSDIRYATQKIARIVSFAKSAYFQRTDSIDLPYVIAGIPFSPERSWGNELWLLAADKLVRNYLGHLNMRERKWDRFVSWSEFILEQKKLPGGQIIRSYNTFHLNLSMDVKYNLQGLLILPHELAHAVCQVDVDTIDGIEIFSVLRYVLYHIFSLKKRLLKILEKCQSENRGRCPLRGMKNALNTKFVNEFIKYMAKSQAQRFIYEGLVDLVAFRLAGIGYVKALKDYTFEPAISHQHPGTRRLTWNADFFFGVLLRLSIITSYFDMEYKKKLFPKELLERAAICFRDIQDESLSILKELLKKKRITQLRYDSNRQCLECISEIGLHIGTQTSEFDKAIFEDRKHESIFLSKKDTAFTPDRNLVKDISKGKARLEAEPRKILDACCEIARKTGGTHCPAGLYSMAFNKHKG